jgi:DNA-binding MarR family transcriptional regulator
MDQVDRILEQWRQERPDLDIKAMGLIGRLARLTLCLRHEMEQTWAAFGLNGASFDVLATLRRSGPPYRLSPGDLLESTMVTSGTMTNRIDQLEKAGFVERIKKPDDGRGVFVALTDKGFKVIDAAITEHVATQNRLISVLSEKDFQRLNAGLKVYLTVLEERKSE